MKSNPLVTILMPVYNGSEYLNETIESILNQSFQDYELLIIDDCSTDNSVDIINFYNDKKINLIINNKNIGQSRTLNKGILRSKGKYISRIDQDDIYHEDKIRKQVDHLVKNKTDILGSWSKIIDLDSNTIGFTHHPCDYNKIKDALPIGVVFTHSSVIFNKKKIIGVGSYSDDFSITMDWELWIRSLKNNLTIESIPEYLVKIRQHPHQTTASQRGKINNYKEAIKLLSESRKFIISEENIKASIGFEHFYKLKLYLFEKKIINIIKFILNLKNFIQLIKLFYFHKIIRKPNRFYNPPTIYIK